MAYYDTPDNTAKELANKYGITKALVRAAFFKIVVAQSCFKQPLSAPARVSRAAPDLASRHR